MEGSRIPLHGARRRFCGFSWRSESRARDASGQHGKPGPTRICWRPDGLTAVTTADGRFTVLMPHPERVFRNVLMSWTSGERSARSPWMRMFGNARGWVDSK
jgi:phosphoribosylformylglycinamidine synthase